MADEFDLKPTSRGEEFLDVILRSLGGDTPDIPQPAWRYEEYLAAIANAIQNGGGGSSGGGVLVVHDVEGTLDKTWQEIWDAAGTGPAYVLTSDSAERDWDSITAVLANSHVLSTASGVFYEAESANDYPVLLN